MKPLAVYLLSALVLCVPPAFAQGVEARSAAPAIDPGQRFESPMVLKLPMPNLAKLRLGSPVHLSGFRGFWCEDARFQTIDVVRRFAPSSGARIEFSGVLEVVDSFDRKASVKVDLLVDGKLLSSGADVAIDAEEEKQTPFRVVLNLNRQQRALLESKPEAVRIVVTLTLLSNR